MVGTQANGYSGFHDSQIQLLTASPSQDSLTDSSDDAPPVIDLPSVTPVKANWYVRFLTRFPYVLPSLLILLVGGLSGYVFTVHKLPTFKDPTMGFEARGSDIRAAAQSAGHMEDEISKKRGAKYNFIPNVVPLASKGLALTHFANNPWQGKSKNSVDNWSDDPTTTDDVTDLERGKRRAGSDWCANQNIWPRAPKMAFESTSGENLFTAKNLHSICKLETTFVSSHLPFPRSCRMHSLALYVAALQKKQCMQIDDRDVEHVVARLRACAPFFHNKSLKENCNKMLCRSVPAQCYEYNAVYKIFNYLVDVSFMSRTTPENTFLNTTAMMFQKKHMSNEKLGSYYKNHIHGRSLVLANVSITGIHLGEFIKYVIFNDYLMQDIKYFVMAASFILCTMLVYLRSPVLVIATVVNVAASFLLAYFVYFVILGFEFFPFLNLLAMLILIAVGADDVFIFHDAWQQAKRDHPWETMEVWVGNTFRHAALSILVTSLTTAAAFFANVVSNITCIRLFGIFAGLAMLANFFMMITWTPSIIILIEIIYTWCCSFCRTTQQVGKTCSDAAHGAASRCSLLLSKVLVTPRFMWLLVFIAGGIGGIVVVFFYPKLKLPVSKDFQLFQSDHPMEKWDMVLKYRFRAGLNQRDQAFAQISVWFWWGLKSEDNGDWFNPKSRGTLSLDSTFNISAKESQMWLLQFVHNLRNQSFVDNSHRLQRFSLDYINDMQSLCKQSTYRNWLKDCCRIKGLPASPRALEQCLPFLSLMKSTFGASAYYGIPIYDVHNQVKAFFIKVKTKVHFSTAYDDMDTLYKQIDEFLKGQLRDAPPGLQKGFFSGRLWFFFYDLQRSISRGTYFAMLLSVSVALVVMLMTSLNVLVTIYAIITITFAIAVTVGCLVLIGWHLNIFESVAISLAVGLSIDFTIHYGVAYRLSYENQRKRRVSDSFARVGFAVAMAALTTFLAGSAMMPSIILIYTKLGIFLMLVMASSWAYATFFFLPLCSVAGPNGNFCQISSPKVCCKRQYDVNQADTHSLSSVESKDSFIPTWYSSRNREVGGLDNTQELTSHAINI